MTRMTIVELAKMRAEVERADASALGYPCVSASTAYRLFDEVEALRADLEASERQREEAVAALEIEREERGV